MTPTFRVIFGLHVDAETAEEAYQRAFAFTAFLKQRKAEGHPQLADVLPVIGPEPATDVSEIGPMPVSRKPVQA